MKADASAKTDYIDALIKEIKGYRDKYVYKEKAYRPATVYIGGGTPSCIDEELIGRVMECLENEFGYSDGGEIEITIEVNPGTVTGEKLKAYKSYGINRLSIGLQSADDNELKQLGRIHNFDDFLKTYEAAREAGFENINVDLMTAIPGQTIRSLEHTLERVTGLSPEHISAYSLIIEENTPFFEKYGDPALRPFDEDTERLMYHTAVEYLREHGYHRYEISNFAKAGHESRHNTSYWKRQNYFGFGLGASSLIDNIRYKNTSSFEKYTDDPLSADQFDEETRLGRTDCMEEFMFLGLRLSEGVSADEFMREFEISIYDEYGKEIRKFMREGLLEEDAGKIRLTENGIDYGNYVFSGFLH